MYGNLLSEHISLARKTYSILFVSREKWGEKLSCNCTNAGCSSNGKKRPF